MRNEIKQAFDAVHAPDELVERMKQELYQQDFHEDIEEMTCVAAEAPRRTFGRYIPYIAACLAICVGCGLSVWSLRDRQDGFHPSGPVVTTVTEETEESTTESLSAAGYGQVQYSEQADMMAAGGSR